jgi:hypothetical protein
MPLVPLLPALSAIVSFGLMLGLPWDTWRRLIVWMAIGIGLYGAYGYRRSRLRIGIVEDGRPLLDDESSFHVPASIVSGKVAVELAFAGLIRAELERHRLTGPGALRDAIPLVGEAVRHVGGLEGDFHEIVLVDDDLGRGEGVILPNDSEGPDLPLLAGGKPNERDCCEGE